MGGRKAVLTKGCIRKKKLYYNKCKCGRLKYWKSRRCTTCYHSDTRKQLSRIESIK